jgi:hypothetical protein
MLFGFWRKFCLFLILELYFRKWKPLSFSCAKTTFDSIFPRKDDDYKFTNKPHVNIIDDHLGDVPGFEEVRGLEDLLVRDAVLLGGGQEGLDVLHEQEGGTLQ